MYYSEPRAPKKPLATALAVGAVTLLAACGGESGGGSDGRSSESAPAINRETVSISSTENAVEVRQLDGVIDPASVEPVSGFDNPAIAMAISDDTITVTIETLENTAEERFTLTTDTGTRYTVVINADNSSAQAVIQEATALTEISSPQALVSDDLRLMNAVLEIEYLVQDISETEKTGTRSATTHEIVTASSALEDQITLLDQSLTDYRNGDVTETDLENALASANASLSDLDESGASAISNVRSTLEAMGVALPADLEAGSPLVFVPEADRYSRFMNRNYGTFDASNNFIFNSEYGFFNAVFPIATSAGSFSSTLAAAKAPVDMTIHEVDGEIRLIVKRAGINNETSYETITVPAERANNREAELLADPSVISVERDVVSYNPIPLSETGSAFTRQSAVTGTEPVTYSDPLYNEQRYFRANETFNSRLSEAHGRLDFTKTIRIGVIDGGFIPSPEVPYVEGATQMGQFDSSAEFYNEDVGCPEGSSVHGHWVSQVAGATTDNGLGIAGAARNIELVAARSLNCNGNGFLSANADSIRYLIGEKVEGSPAISEPVDIINMSLGAMTECPGYMQEAIDSALEMNIPVVVAAGNNGLNSNGYTPANCAGVITVAATTSSGAAATYSNLGENVAIAAQGSRVVALNEDGSTAFIYGTSFATPLVAGVIASTLSDRNLTVSEIAAIIAGAGKPLLGNSVGAGAGILDSMLFLDGAGIPRETVTAQSALGGEREQFQLVLTHPTAEAYLQSRTGSAGACEFYEINGEYLNNPTMSDSISVFSVADGEPLSPANSTAAIINSTNRIEKLVVSQADFDAATANNRQLGVAHCNLSTGTNCSVKDTVKALNPSDITLPGICSA